MITRLLAASARSAREHGWAVHTRLAECARRSWWPGCDGAGPAWSGPPTSACWRRRWWRARYRVGEREIELLHGAGVAMVHNPVANTILGSGVCPLAALVEASRPPDAELATRAGLGGLSRLATPAG